MSQRDQIHDELRNGPATALDLFRRCGAFRAAARIFELRQSGVKISTRLVRRGRFRVAEYRLDA